MSLNIILIMKSLSVIEELLVVSIRLWRLGLRLYLKSERSGRILCAIDDQQQQQLTIIVSKSAVCCMSYITQKSHWLYILLRRNRPLSRIYFGNCGRLTHFSADFRRLQIFRRRRPNSAAEGSTKKETHKEHCKNIHLWNIGPKVSYSTVFWHYTLQWSRVQEVL